MHRFPATLASQRICSANGFALGGAGDNGERTLTFETRCFGVLSLGHSFGLAGVKTD